MNELDRVLDEEDKILEERFVCFRDAVIGLCESLQECCDVISDTAIELERLITEFCDVDVREDE